MRKLQFSLEKWREGESRNDFVWRWGLQLGSLALVLSAWQYLALRSGGFSLPPLNRIAIAWTDLVVSGKLVAAIAESNAILLIGLAAAITVGLPWGLLLGRFQRLDSFAGIYLDMLLAVPKVALAPLLVIGFGLGPPAKIVVVFLFSVVYVAANSRAGLRKVDDTLVEMARSFGGNEREIMLQVMLPSAVPAVMAGIRLALAHALIGMVVAELWLAAGGLGGLILSYKAAFKAHYVFATVLTVVFEGVLLLALSQRLEARLLRWRGMQSAKSIAR